MTIEGIEAALVDAATRVANGSYDHTAPISLPATWEESMGEVAARTAQVASAWGAEALAT